MFNKSINFYFFIFVLYSVYCAIEIGINWDTFYGYSDGKDRLAYLFSLGADDSYKNAIGRKYYAGLYSTISAFLVQFFPIKYNVEVIYLTNLFFSFCTIFGISKLSKELFNKEIGKIVFVFCMLNAIFFGHMATNSKDTIVAFSNVWALYSIIKYLKYQNIYERRKKFIIFSGLSIGFGLGVRLSFFATIIPIIFFLLLEIFLFKKIIPRNFSIKRFLIDSIIVLLIAYFIMILFWPDVHKNIFIYPFKLAIESFSFSFGAPLGLLNGYYFPSHDYPKNYILVNLFYKMPEFIVLSFLIFPLILSKILNFFEKRIYGFRSKLFLIFLILIFPNIVILFSHYPLYDGMRLFLYLIPFINIFPAILLYYLFKNRQYILSKFFITILIALQFFYILNFFAVTPYHYVYLNLFAGKYSENSKKFENDYWGISTKKLIEKLEKKNNLFGDSRINVATCGMENDAANYYLKKIRNLNYKMVDQYKGEKYDIIIMNNRVVWDDIGHINPYNGRTCFEKFSGDDIITIKRRGLILSKITKSTE